VKNYYYLISIFFFLSCSNNYEKNYNIPLEVIITGRIDNADPLKEDIVFSVNRPGRAQKNIKAKIDSLGNFSASFKSYTPTDVFVNYNYFYMLIHPGDSLFVTFNGNTSSPLKLLESIKYSGDAAKINQDAAAFQHMYYSNSILQNREAKNKARKELDVEDYLMYLDTMRINSQRLLDKFEIDVAPEKETKLWASTFIEQNYFDALAHYPYYHRIENNLKKNDWDVPENYYNSLLNRFPISKSMLICGSALSNFINIFHFLYVLPNTNNDVEYKKYIDKNLNYTNISEIRDSLRILGIIKYTPGDLAKQLVLTEEFHLNFDKSEIDLFEKNKDIAELHIKEPFLIEPIIERYQTIKSQIENPQITSDVILRKLENSSAKQIMDSIMISNKGKVIYIDFWATWCGPCMAEFPNSKALMKQMDNKDVSFIFLCLDSKEKIWKAKLDELNLSGQHYFLSKKQSDDIREAFEISGIPYYILVDKNGMIHEKGNHLIPKIAKEKINKLLQ